MAIVTIKTKPFRYSNFVHLPIPDLPGQAGSEFAVDVGHAFPTDEDAARYWEEAKAGWIKHVAERRAALTHSGELK